MSNICLFNIWHLTVTLTLSLHMDNMGSAYPLVKVNVSFKFEDNPSISKGVIERTRIGDGRTADRPTGQSESSIPSTFRRGGILIQCDSFVWYCSSKLILNIILPISRFKMLNIFCIIIWTLSPSHSNTHCFLYLHLSVYWNVLYCGNSCN